MRNRSDDLRNILLIAGAGAVGVLGTLFVTSATERPAVEADQTNVREQAVVEAMERAQEVRQRVVVGSASRSEDGVAVRFRGSSRLSLANQPVIYIDGVRVNGDRDEAMKKVKPDQIDRIEVIKGDAARRHYGSEAENGVIQIFTKSSAESSKKEDGSGR